MDDTSFFGSVIQYRLHLTLEICYSVYSVSQYLMLHYALVQSVHRSSLNEN